MADHEKRVVPGKAGLEVNVYENDNLVVIVGKYNFRTDILLVHIC